MQIAVSRLLAAFAAVMLFASLSIPARAAAISTIPVKSAADLMVPNSSAPAGFTINQGNGRTINNALMLTVLGKHMNYLFHKDGWTTGYHGWLDANDPTGDAFVTYDFYGFKTSAGAKAATASYQGLVLGVENPISDNRVPSNATVFIDGTGTFDPNGQPYTVVEIVFQVDNVMADVTGYFAGGDSAAADAAREVAVAATASLSDWLQAQITPAQHSSIFWPLVPVALFVPGKRALTRRRGA